MKSPTDIVSEFLQNTAPDKIEAAVERLIAEDATYGEGEDLAVFGEFTYRSNTRRKSFRSPLAIHARVRDGKIVHFMFMEDTFLSARSFSSGGTWTIQTEPGGPEFQV